MPMDREEKRLDTALEAVKQQITLATAIIGAALALSDQLTGVREGRVWAYLPIAFVPLAISAISGVLTLMSVSYYLGGQSDPMRQKDVRTLGIIQNLSFMLAVLAMVFIVAMA